MNNNDTYAINLWLRNYELNMVNILHKDIIFLKTEQLISLNRRFKYVIENPIFYTATFLHFKFKKFEFIRNEYESIKYLNMEKEYLKKYYTNPLNNNKNNNETQIFLLNRPIKETDHF